MTTVLLLADAAVTGSGESKKSGPIGLAIILVLCIACYFLFKSMSKHLRRVRNEFPDADAPDRASTPPETAPKPPPGATQPGNGDDPARAP